MQPTPAKLSFAQNEGANSLRQHQLNLLLDSTGEGIFGIDLDGHCVLINRAGARLLGWDGVDALDHNMHELTHHSHADGSHYPDTKCPIFNAFRQGLACRIDTERFWRKDCIDALTCGTIQDELKGIVRETRQTVFMITHDVDEAILLADRILLMTNGQELPGGSVSAETGKTYVPGGFAEVVINHLPRNRNRTGLHQLDGFYDLRNHIVDFLVSRAKAH